MRLSLFLAGIFVYTCNAQPWPLREIGSKGAAAKISIVVIHWQELKYGHEGPDYFSVDREPYAGQQELAEVTIAGQEAVRAIQFEMIGDAGQRISAIPAIREDDGADADEYLLRVDTPRQPFRIRMQGQDLQGRAFSEVFPHRFLPQEGAAPPLDFPPGFTPDQARLLRGLVDTFGAESRARFDAALRNNPGGLIRIPQSGIVDATYEPLTSPLGNSIGMRVRFAVRFEQAGYYALTPHVFPVFANFQWRGVVTMKVLDGAVSPAPPAAPGNPVDGIADVLRYSGKTYYAANTIYRFAFDLVPDYVIRNADGNRYCLYTEQFRGRNSQAAWEAIQASQEPVQFRVDISSVDFEAETAALPPVHTYYEAFQREGARDCGPEPNIHF